MESELFWDAARRLREAISYGQVEPAEVSRALGDGVPVDHRLEGTGTTALMIAAGSGDVNLVCLLRRHGARADLLDDDGASAALYAAKGYRSGGNPHPDRCFAVLNLLVDMGASLDVYDELGGAPLRDILLLLLPPDRLLDLAHRGMPLVPSAGHPPRLTQTLQAFFTAWHGRRFQGTGSHSARWWPKPFPRAPASTNPTPAAKPPWKWRSGSETTKWLWR